MSRPQSGDTAEANTKTRKGIKTMRFQKRIKILPGISINLSKSGVSTSIGPKGAKATFGHGRQRTTVGIPGTGLSHTESSASNVSGAHIIVVVIILAALIALFS